MSGLTEEQKKRIEENKKRALAKRAVKVAQQQKCPLSGAQQAQSMKPSTHVAPSNQASTNWNGVGRGQSSNSLLNSGKGQGSGSNLGQAKSQSLNSHQTEFKAGGQSLNSPLTQPRTVLGGSGFQGNYKNKNSSSSLTRMINASSAQQIHQGSNTSSHKSNTLSGGITSQNKNTNSSVILKAGNSSLSGNVSNSNSFRTCITGNSGATAACKTTPSPVLPAQHQPTSTPGFPSSSSNVNRNISQSSFYKSSASQNQAQHNKFQNETGVAPNTDKGVKNIPQSDLAAAVTSDNSFFSKKKTAAVKGSTVLISRDRFVLSIGYCSPLVEICKTMKTRQYDSITKRWDFKLEEYEELMRRARVLMQQGVIELEGLPQPLLQAFKPACQGKITDNHVPNADLTRVPDTLTGSLMPFQRDGVNFAISREGRVIIADDMGLGKTIQSICVACYYRKEWPLLVVVPSSVRFAWSEQLQRWIPDLNPDDINVVVTGKDDVTAGKVVIVSYDMMTKKKNDLQHVGFKVAILDESHFLKNFRTARCQAAQLILKVSKRVILLSGTPALSRPAELYTQLRLVKPQLFPNFHLFGLRYCDGKQNNFGWDYSGSSNLPELQLLLEKTIMIRRLKKDVLQQLPAKRRQMIVLDPELVKVDKNLKSSAKLLDSNKIKGSDRHGFLLTYFHDTGQAKVKAVRDYVIDLLESGHKFLVFAHHKEVLDALEEAVRKERYGYIRIDGKTNPEQRNFFCQKFQTRDDVMVAILSITAANAGLNLTSAALVVFAELFWNPGILVQAEDRCHRIGQQDSVNIHYLVARKTADNYIWPLVQKKLSVLGKVGLSKEDFSEADTTVLKDKKQKDILSYFEESFMEESDIPQVHDKGAANNQTLASSSNQKSEHPRGQRSMLQFVSNGSKGSTVKGEQLAAERLKDEDNVMSVDEELTGDWLDELDEEWDEPAEKKVKVAHSER